MLRAKNDTSNIYYHMSQTNLSADKSEPVNPTSSMTSGKSAENIQQEIRTLLEADSASSSQSSNLIGSIGELAELLYKRSTDNFFNTRGTQALVEIAKEVHGFYADFTNSTNPWKLKAYNPKDSKRNDTTVLLIAISDRPFVVDTVSEFLRSKKLSTKVFLHPIVTSKFGTTTSLSYIELETPVEDESLESITEELSITLTELLTVTDSFKPTLIHADSISRLLSISETLPEVETKSNKELSELFKWLADGGLFFLGYREWKINDDEGAKPVSDSDLGLFTSENSSFIKILSELSEDAITLFKSEELLQISKIPLISPVHRLAFIEQISVRIPGERVVRTFLGLPTSRAISQEVSSIPILRKKLALLLESEGALPNSYDHKEILSLVSSIPKSELFQATLSHLQEAVKTVLDVQQHDGTRILVTRDQAERFSYVMVVMLRERFNSTVSSKVQKEISNEFGVDYEQIAHRIAITEDQLVRIHFTIPHPSEKPEINVQRLEENIEALTLTWDDRLKTALRNSEISEQGMRFLEHFPEDYKATRAPAGAKVDLLFLDNLSETNSFEANLESINDENSFALYIYKSGALLSLSEIVPLLENTGFHVISETVTQIVDDISIYKFEVETCSESAEFLKESNTNFINAFVRVLKNEAGKRFLKPFNSKS